MLREFKDTNGTEWLVWDVYPDQREASASDPAMFPHRELSEGWLCFESPSEKRRLAPIPRGWQEWSADRLATLLITAGYISRPGTRVTPGGSTVHDDEVPPSRR